MYLPGSPEGETSHSALGCRCFGSTDDGSSASNSLQLVSIFRKKEGHDLEATGMTNDEASSSTHIENWLQQACDLLERQWPRKPVGSTGDSVSSSHYYHEKIIKDADALQTTSTSHPCMNTLPCSFLLIANAQCVGHGRLTECFESAGGNAAAITFLVVDESMRGKKIGTLMMKLLEQQAQRIGYHYIYLWTTMAIGFYEKNGYEECHRVSLKRDCLKSLDASHVEGLEDLLLKRRRKGEIGSMELRASETVLLARSDGRSTNAKDIWMRKRLVEYAGSQKIPLAERLADMRTAVALVQQSMKTQCTRWRYLLRTVPWHPQIGPSCGLVALRMVLEYFLSQGSMALDRPLPSLLKEAKARKYTNDGEIFDANNLAKLATDVCDIDCDVKSLQLLKPADFLDGLCRGGLWIIPYDSNQRTKLPGSYKGKNAHYGIVVGVLVMSAESGDGAPSEGDDTLLPFEDRDFDLDASTVLNDPSGPFLLLVQHGLSPRLSIASFGEFGASNAQLESMDIWKFGDQHLDLKDRILLCTELRSAYLESQLAIGNKASSSK